MQFAEAVVAHGDVGRDERPAGRRDVAVDDVEAALADHFDRRRLDGVDAGERRPLDDEPVLERGDPGRVSFDLDEHAVGVVADVPTETQPRCQAMHEWPKAHALNHASNADSMTNGAAVRQRRDHGAKVMVPASCGTTERDRCFAMESTEVVVGRTRSF